MMFPHVYQHFSVPVSAGVLHACVRAPFMHEALRKLQDDDPCWSGVAVYYYGSEVYDAHASRLRPAAVNFWMD